MYAYCTSNSCKKFFFLSRAGRPGCSGLYRVRVSIVVVVLYYLSTGSTEGTVASTSASASTTTSTDLVLGAPN